MESESTLVLMSGTLGDTALTLPLLHALARQSPVAPLVVARSENLPVLKATRFPLQTASYDRPPWNSLFHERSADVADAVQHTLNKAGRVVNLLDTAGGSVHRNLKHWGKERLKDIPSRPPQNWHVSVAEYYLTACGLTIKDLPHGPFLTQELLQVDLARKMQARSDLQHHARHAGRPIVLLHPGSGGLSKCWPAERFCALAEKARGVLFDPVFLVGPDEVERFGRKLLFQLQGFAPVLGPMPLEDALAHVGAGDAYVGNDAGLTHVAGLLGTTTVAIFGPTNPQLWRPCGPRVTVIHKPQISDITVDEVLGTVEQALG